tara:strand:- start:2781 stop:3929 length:1149 start_codon:yes stop_codon:yes gene_type:complete
MKLHFDDVKGNLLDVRIDKRTEVYNWGEDNAQPSLIEVLIRSSVTAKSAVDKISKAIYGNSFGDLGSIIINKEGKTLNQMFRLSSKEYAKQNNVYLQVTYNAELKINGFKMIPTVKVRAGKDDSRGYFGKYIVYNNWDKNKTSRIESTKFSIYDVFNPNPKVIAAQIEAAKGIGNYKGQILVIQKPTNDIYAESDLVPVMDEALLEANSQKFRSRGAEKGFLNIKIMVVKPFTNDDDRRDFKRNLEDAQGAENAGRVLLLESNSVTGDLKEDFTLGDLSSPYNDTLFKYSDEQAKKNIALAFGIPRALLDLSDNTLFGDSAAMISSMKNILWESREEDRDIFEETFNLIGKYWHDETYPKSLKIASPYIANPNQNTTNGTNN